MDMRPSQVVLVGVVVAIVAGTGARTRFIAPGQTVPSSPGDVTEVVLNRARLPWSDVRGTVAHELGHCVAIDHHGHGMEYVSGADVACQPVGGPESTAMGLLDEKSKYCVAVWGAEHSGNVSCMMRYAWADLYRRDTGLYYPYPQDTKGTSLCTSQKGTGLNGGEQRKQVVVMQTSLGMPLPVEIVLPMCGDGTADKGCLYQIHVSDAR